MVNILLSFPAVNTVTYGQRSSVCPCCQHCSYLWSTFFCLFLLSTLLPMVHGHSPECCIQSWNSLHESLKHSRNIQLKPIRTIITRICLKGYSSGQIHFSEINVKLAEKNEFATQFVQKLLEMRENRQNVVLNESSEGFRNHSEFVWILVLAMTTAS